ncbi:MAG: EVE domain-containing protein [Dehalococcoidia bacterium]|nr:EVE domain-containing protein [Dehalococcoidia bacterium]
MFKWWLVVGSPQNWQTAFEHGNLWGLKGTQQNLWEHLSTGDRVLLYASSPVRGLIGYGTVRNKFRQDRPLWPEEVKQNKTLWPLIFEFDIEYCLPQDRWRSDSIINDALRNRVRRRQMLQMLEEGLANELVRAFSKEAREPLFAVAETEALGVPPNPHDEIIAKLLEIGRLQKFLTEKEYDMEGYRLDAVWRRVEKAVPTYVFEVHIGGDLHRSLAKLKHAFDIWNSNIFLVASKEDRKNADRLLSGLFHEIRDRLRFIELEKVDELLKQKKGVHDLEAELGIP